MVSKQVTCKQLLLSPQMLRKTYVHLYLKSCLSSKPACMSNKLKNVQHDKDEKL